MKASSGNNTRISRSTGGKRKLLSGTGGAALALALFLPSTAWAEDYTAGTEAELSQRILEANADGDPSSTITLIGHIPLSGPLPASTKPLIINTGAFAVLNLALTGIVTVNGTVGGNDDLAGGAGQTGLSLVALGGVLTTVTNNAIVTGGDGNGTGANGIGAVVQNNGNLINNGSITGGSSGGPGTLAGGRGIEVSGNATVVNNGLIQGGVGHTVTGGTGAYVGVGASGVQSFTNNASGIVRGGRSTSGALGGVGIELRTLTVPIINRGLIEGGNGAAAIQASTQPVNIINSGTIRAGVDGTVAMDFSQAQLVLLELQAGSSITGLVIANAAPTFAQTLQLGGTVDASFDMSSVGAGAQYRNFNRFVKTGTSSWTLTGNAGGMPNSPWELQQGTLVFDDTATGQTPAMLGSGALVFQQDGNLSVGNLNGALSVLQSGPGTTTLVGNAHSGGTTITGGRLSIGTEAALGSGAFTIDGGTLQWTGAGNIARTIGWGASGGGFEVAGGNLILLRPLLGGGALTKSGTGTLTLAGDNTYMGGTTIAAGTLNIGSGGTTGSVLGDILNNSTLQFNRSNDYTYAGAITGTGGLAKAGTGTTTLTGQNNYGSGTSLSSGQLLIAGGGTTTSGGATSITALAASTPVLGVDGAGSAFTTASINATGNTNRSLAINVTNGGLLRTTSGGLSLRTAQLLPSSTNTAQLTIDGGGSLADLAGGLTIASVSTNTGSVSISGGGALRTGDVSAIGFATGNTRVLPTVTITGAGSNWTSTNSLVMSNGGFTLDQGGTASFASAAFGTASAVLQAKLTVSGATSRFTTTSGDLVIGSGTGTGELVLTDGGAVDVAGSLVLADGGTASGILSIGGGEGQAAAAMGAFTAPTVTLGSASSRINFNHTGIGQLFGAAIAGAGAINHVAGDTVLTGNSAGFTGATTVSGGTLRVNGTLGGAASTVTVRSGGRLGGSGTIGGNVTVTNGVLAPGNSPGTLTIAGDLTLTGGSLLDFEFGQSNVVGGPLNDLIEVGGNLTLDGTIDVTVTPGGEFDVGVYRVISYAGSLNDQGLLVGATPGGSIVAVQKSIANQINLVNFAGADVNFWDGNGARGDGSITGGDGIWQASGGNDNWTVADGSVNTPYPNDAFAVFMAAPGTVTVEDDLGAVRASGMQFASNGYLLTGDAIALTGTQSVIRVGDGTTTGAGFVATIESALTGAGDLVKTDLGTLVLTGANSFAGDAIVRTGGLRLTDGGTLSSLNTIIGRDAGEQAVLTITGSDGGGNASTWTSGELTVGYFGTGSLNVTAGGRMVSSDSTIGLDTGGVGHVLVSGSGSTWQNSGRINLGLSGTGTMRIENGAQVSSNDGVVGASALGEVVVTGAGSSWANATQLVVGSFGTGTLRIENGASVTSNQGFVGANADGAATVTGAGSNWLVTDFSLTVGNQGNGALTIENGARVQALGGLSLGAAAGSNGTLTLLGTAADRGILETRQIGAGPGTVSVTLNGGLLRATRNASSFFTGFGARDVTLGANGGAIDTNGYDIGIAPRFVGAGGLIKEGAGTLTLTGANAYAGTTTVNAGTLLVNGDQSAATGLTTIAAAATLGGIGTIGGSVDMSAGGTLAPGNSPGTLTINGNLLLGAGTQLNFELGQANVIGGALNDLVNVGGNLTLDGTLNVTEPAGGSFGVGIYRLINYGGTLTNNGLTVGSLPTGGTAFVQTAIGGQVNLINTGGQTLNFWDGGSGPKFDSVINGGTGIWQNSAGNDNWTDASGAVNAAFTDNAVAIFGGSAGTVTVDNGLGAVSVTGMQFATSGYVITGGAVTLTGPQATVRVGDGTAGSTSHIATIASELTGASQLVKTDLGTLALLGTNGYSGGTRIDAGTLRLGNGGATGSITGDIVNNGALVVNRSGTIALDGVISGTGTLAKAGSGTLILGGANSYAGGTTVSGGTVRISSDANLGDVAGRLSLQGGTLQAAASFTSAREILVGSPNSNRIDTQGFDVTLTGTIGNGANNQAGNFLDKVGSGTLTLTGANIYANRTVISGGTLALAGDGTAGAGNIIVGAGTVFDISQTNTGARVIQLNSGPAGTIALGSKMLTLGLDNSFSDWSGTITDGGIAGGTGGRVVIGGVGGAVRFFEANSYTGGTTILSGSFELVGNGSLYSGGAVSVVTGGTFSIASLAGPGTTIGDLSGSGSGSTPGAVVLGGKTLTFGTANDTFFSGAILGNGGTLVKSGAGVFSLTGSALHTGGTTISAGTLQIGMGGTTGSIAGDVVDNATLAFNRSNTLTLDGTISGTGAVSQLGTGTTVLTAANSYTGTTTVAAGTLRINGDQSAATGLTNVLNGGTLGGTGTIGGSVTVADGGTLAPGNSPGTLTIAGNLALSSGSLLAFEFGQANTAGGTLNDLINVGGDLTLDGTIDVTQSAGGAFGPGVYRIINYGGTLINNGLTVGSMPAGSQGFVQTVVPGQVNLVNTAGLTLGFWDGAAGTKNDGAIQGGVGTWRVGGGENNWTEASGAVNADYAQDSFAIFSGLGGTVTIDNSNGNVRAAGMQFTVDGYTLMGGPLELTGTQAFVRVGDGSAGDAAITATIASALTGSARLVKDMGGTLILTGANSYTGGTAINGGTLNVSSDANLGDASGGLSFDGGTLDITTTFASNRAVDLVGTGTLVTQGTGFVLRGVVSGAGALVKEGNGSLTLTADNSHTGGTTINAGVLNLGDGGTTGSILGNIVNNGRFTINRSNMYTLTGTISGSGELFQAGTGTTILTAANSYTGATRVSAGTLLINGDQSAATGLTSLAANATLGGTGTIGGDVRVGGGTLAPGMGGAGTLTINGDLSMVAGSRLAVDFGAANAVGSPLNDLVNVGGNLTLDGTIDIAVTPGGAFDIGLYRIANYAGTLTNNGLAIGTMPTGAELAVQTSVLGQVNLVNTGSAVLNFWDGNTGPKFNGVVNGGSGVWWATGTDNWTDMTGAVNASYDNGAFAVFAGVSGAVNIDNSQGAVTASGLQFAASGGYRIQGGALTLTGPQSVIRVGDGTSAGLGYSAIIASEITGNTQLVKTDLGRLELTGTNSYTGGTAINGGTVRISSDANLGAASGGISFNGGTLNTTANISSARAVDLAGQGVFSTDAGTTLTLTGNLTGAGLIGKLGAGTLVFAGTGSRTGGIEVVQGTLLVNGNYAAATGLVTMNQIATLGGTGTIGGNVNLSGTLAPGANGVGTLTINGDLLISPTATLAYEFGQANVAGGALNDLVNVGGNLILDGTINVTVPTGGAFGAGIYRVFNYGGTLTDNGLTLGAMPAGSNVGVQTSIAGQVNLINFAGLALNFWDGAAGPKNNGVVNGGSGVWQSSGGNDNWTDAAGLVNAGYSDGAFAVFGGAAGTVTVDNSLGQVTAGGMQFATTGYTITGGGIALTGGQATIRVGDGSTAGAGYTATINAALSGASELVKTDAGTLVLGGTNSYTGGTRITGGTVQIASDPNLGAAAGGLTFDGGALAATATLTSARGVNFLGAGTLSTANGTTFTLSGTLTGTSALTKAGAGTLLLTGNNGGYTGATRVTGGTLAVMGAFGGAVDVGAGTRLEGTGSVGAVTNAGTVAPGRDGFGTLTVNGSYTGSNGILAIDAELGGDNSRADRLVVNGATAGNTVINVTNQGGLGAATVDGIKIIDVTGASNGAFALGNSDYLFEGDPALIAGAYGYRLYKNGVTTPADGDWYLRSSLLQPTTPETPNIPLYQPGVPVYEAYGQTLAALNQIGTMQERTGNRQWAEGNAQSFGIWGRMESKRARPEAVRSTSFTDVNIDSWKVELGADKVLSERADGASLVLGVLGSYGEANASIASSFGNGSIKTRGYSAGATLSWFGPQGFYVDGRAQVSWFDSKLTSTVLGKLADDNKGTGQAYSVEIGKRAPMGAGLSITPQIQTVYSTVGFDRFTDPNDAAVSSKLGDSLKTRWGFSLDRQDGRSHIYGVVNLSYEWLDGTVTDVSGTPIARENHRLWGELGLGGSVKLGGRLVLYSEVSADTAINDFGDSYALKGVAGLRMAF